MPLLELEQSFIEKFHTYLSHDLGMSPNGLSDYLKCLKYVVKMAFNNGWMDKKDPMQRLWTQNLIRELTNYRATFEQ